MRNLFTPLVAVLSILFCGASPVRAHDEPTSFLDLRLRAAGIEVVVVGSTTDFAHDLPAVEPAMLLEPERIARHQEDLARNVLARLRIVADGAPLTGKLRSIAAVPEQRDLRLVFDFAWTRRPEVMQVAAQLFPYDPRHKTFANVYAGEELQRQEIFEGARTTIEFRPAAAQSTWAVVRQFVYEGIHHIFIGPDHILFVIGLLLLGGSLTRLTKIVTAFTVAHSITLGLATFGVVNPPASLVEPVIALSIVFVGVHALLGRDKADARMLFAFGFGLVHGFGFASVLAAMALPQHALAWSLFAFNSGVEIGQLCIVAVVAPLLALIRRRSEVAGERTATAVAYGVVLAGAFWFFQRLMS